jgi:hypothetical protein
MNYADLLESHKKFLVDKAYEELILPAKKPFENIDNIIEFVRKWNRRVPIGKNKDRIKEVVLSLRKDFESISRYNLEDFKFTPNNVEIVESIFDKLSLTALKFTGTTKLMHGICQNLFVMWDKGICEHYGCYPNSKGYVIFMKLMQEGMLKILKQHNKGDVIKETGVSLPKLLDEYNWLNFGTSKMRKAVNP